MKTITNRVKKNASKMFELVNNNRGDANSTSQLMWIVIVVAVVIAVWGFIDGWLPQLFNKLTTSINQIWS